MGFADTIIPSPDPEPPEPPEPIGHTIDFGPDEIGEPIWIPETDKCFVITGYHLSFDIAGAITVWAGDTETLDNRVFRHYGSIQGGAALAIVCKSTTPDIVLRYTTDVTAEGSLSMFGYEE